MKSTLSCAFVLLTLITFSRLLRAEPATPPASPPAVGDHAADFELSTLDDKPIKLSELTEKGPVVLIQLRGWVGYQCPLCTKQIAQFMGKASELKDAGAQVVLVYPGPADKLKDHASDFITGKSLPDNFHFVIDPDLKFVTAYGLRWDAKGETAYPATLVIDKTQTVRYAKISHSHGDRANVKDVLEALAKL